MKIGFFGFGSMGSAIGLGLLENQNLKSEISVYKRSQENLAALDKINYIFDLEEFIKQDLDFLILAVKPKDFTEILAQLKPKLSTDTVIISIAAGITLNNLSSGLPEHQVIRTMPNTPSMVAAGITSIASDSKSTPESLEKCSEIFKAVGEVVLIEEKFFDQATAIAGSGPAYFFYMTEAMVAAGVKLGLAKEDAVKLAKHTAYGAGKLLVSSEKTPKELKVNVISPNGTTAAAINTMEAASFDQTMADALTAASERSRELAN
jgi:pyrroline-5-carboxylate reductase